MNGPNGITLSLCLNIKYKEHGRAKKAARVKEASDKSGLKITKRF